MFDKLRKFLTGDDIFISYSRRDGDGYATNLANKLVDLKFSVFFDQWTTPAGRNLPASLLRKLKRSSLLVVVGTKQAAESARVRQEISEFNRVPRPVVPIIFEGVRVLNLVSRDGALDSVTQTDETADAIWSELVEGLAFEAERNSNLTDHNPSAAVIDRITATCKFTKKSRRLFRTGVTILTISGLVALGFTIYARSKRNQAQTAIMEAERQQMLAAEAQNAANAARAEKESARKETQQQMKLALAASQRADEQTRIATAAEARTIEARTRADKEASRARTNLAASYFTQAQVQALTDPRRGIVWASKAVEAAPPEDLRRSIYSLRTARLVSEMPMSVVNTPGPIVRAVFDEANDRALVFRSNGNVALWDLKTGRQIGNVLGFVGRVDPIFSRDGNWIAALVLDLEATAPSDRKEHYRLRVWNAANGDMRVDIPTPLEDGPRSIAFSPTGDQVVVFGDFTDDKSEYSSHSLRVWDRTTGAPLKFVEPVHLASWETLKGYPFERQQSVPLSQVPARNWFLNLTTGQKGRELIEIRNIKDGTLVKQFGNQGDILFADFSADAKKVVTVSMANAAEEELRIWDIDSGQSKIIETRTVEHEPGRPTLSRDPAPNNVFDIVDISADGQNLLMREKGRHDNLEIWYCRDWGLFVLDLKSDQSRDPFREGNGLTHAFFSSDGRFVVETAQRENNFLTRSEVRVWDVDTRRIISPRTSVPDEAVSDHLSPTNMILSVSLSDGSLMAWNLMRNRNALEERQLFPDEDLKYKAYLTPNASKLLSFWNEDDYDGDFGFPKMNLFDLRSYSAIMPQAVPISFYRGLSRVSFSPDGSRFLVSLYHPKNQFAEPLWRMYRATDGNLVPDFKGILGFFRALHFNRDGTMLISAKYNSAGKIEIRRWAALTGDPLPTISTTAASEASAFVEFEGFTRFADYCVMTHADDSRNVIVQSVGASRRERFEARFADYGTSALAIALLLRAREVRLEANVISLTVASGATISIRHSPLGDQILDDRSGSQLRFPLATGGSDFWLSSLESSYGTIEDINDDATLVVVRTDEHKLKILETRTGQSVSEPLWQEVTPAVVKFVGNGQLLTVDETGRQRVWYVGALNRRIPSWMDGLGEAVSGIRLVAQTELQQIPQNKYGPLRQQYIEKLRRAAESGDPEAQAVLRNLQP